MGHSAACHASSAVTFHLQNQGVSGRLNPILAFRQKYVMMIHASYLTQAKTAVQSLLAERLLLPEDIG
jgi:hypothetical protein